MSTLSITAGIYAGIVRHMRPTQEGHLLIHQSSTNRIMLVTLKHPITLRNR
jgi:virginiamycin B lyase